MRQYSVSQFKAHALGILQGVAETGESVIVTKRGKPLARVSPIGPAEPEMPRPGRLSGTIAFEEDIAAPPNAANRDAARKGAKS